jgi:hypothetical protein
MSTEIIKNFCLRCNFETNHNVIHKETKRSDNDDFDYVLNYLMVKCNGCERISFRDEFINLEDMISDEDNNWHPNITIDTYPAKIKIKRKLQDIYILPTKIKIVYEEAIKAFNNDCFLLTGVAFRAIIEAICIEKAIQGKDLAKKIDNLVRQKLITEKEAQRLHSIRFLGNDSVHEMNVPDKKKLIMVLNIVEHLLNNLYIIDYQTRNHLETIINKFEEFEELLDSNLVKFEINDEIPLTKILGKSSRRLNGKTSEFENQLKIKIRDGEYKKLELGKIDVYGNDLNQVQHFKKIE